MKIYHWGIFHFQDKDIYISNFIVAIVHESLWVLAHKKLFKSLVEEVSYKVQQPQYEQTSHISCKKPLKRKTTTKELTNKISAVTAQFKHSNTSPRNIKICKKEIISWKQTNWKLTMKSSSIKILNLHLIYVITYMNVWILKKRLKRNSLHLGCEWYKQELILKYNYINMESHRTAWKIVKL